MSKPKKIEKLSSTNRNSKSIYTQSFLDDEGLWTACRDSNEQVLFTLTSWDTLEEIHDTFLKRKGKKNKKKYTTNIYTQYGCLSNAKLKEINTYLRNRERLKLLKRVIPVVGMITALLIILVLEINILS